MAAVFYDRVNLARGIKGPGFAVNGDNEYRSMKRVSKKSRRGRRCRGLFMSDDNLLIMSKKKHSPFRRKRRLAFYEVQ